MRSYRPRGLSLGATFDQLLGMSPAAGDVVRLVGHGAAAVIGFHLFADDRKAWKWLGLALGIGHACAGLGDVYSLVQRALAPAPPPPPPLAGRLGQITIQAPYLLRKDADGEVWRLADGSTQKYSWARGRWEPVEARRDSFYRMFHVGVG